MSKFLELLAHPDEALAVLKFKLSGGDRVASSSSASSSANLKRCYELLNLTSRSFAMVIQKLDAELRVPVCLFYLVLRALDTIEDDMTLPVELKTAQLLAFHEKLTCKGWTFTQSGPAEKDRQLLVEFDKVVAEYVLLKPVYQEAIGDITRRMGAGMVEFIHKRGVDTRKEWDLYCHYVAGLVGIGLSRLFSRSALEDPAVETREQLANSMGLFLQKTNIIRDYLEDINDGRIFWPAEVWRRYASQLDHFKQQPAHKVAALACLNDLITDALKHVPDVFAYLAQIKNPSVYNFCAIPQVMAIATLALCYNNQDVFTSVVKLRRGKSIKLILESTSVAGTAAIFDRELSVIEDKFAYVQSPYNDTAELIRLIRSQTGLPASKKNSAVQVYKPTRSFLNSAISTLVPIALTASVAYYFGQYILENHEPSAAFVRTHVRLLTAHTESLLAHLKTIVLN